MTKANKLILKYFIPIKNKCQNGIKCRICFNKGIVSDVRNFVPSKRCNSKDPFDIDKDFLKEALRHLKIEHRKKNE